MNHREFISIRFLLNWSAKTLKNKKYEQFRQNLNSIPIIIFD